MNELLSTLLQAVIIAAVPICVGAAIKGIQAGAKYLASKTENEAAKKYLEDVADAVSTAVTYTSQTYVDALKKSDKFTKENQEAALQMAVDKAETLMTAEARAFLEKAYGDLNAYLVSRIEAEVRVQKQQANAVLLGEPLTAELKEAPDVTTVAATAAAATVAATSAATAAVVEKIGTKTYDPHIEVKPPDSPQEGGAAPVV